MNFIFPVILNEVKNPFCCKMRFFASLRMTQEAVALNEVKGLTIIKRDSSLRSE